MSRKRKIYLAIMVVAGTLIGYLAIGVTKNYIQPEASESLVLDGEQKIITDDLGPIYKRSVKITATRPFNLLGVQIGLNEGASVVLEATVNYRSVKTQTFNLDDNSLLVFFKHFGDEFLIPDEFREPVTITLSARPFYHPNNNTVNHLTLQKIIVFKVDNKNIETERKSLPLPDLPIKDFLVLPCKQAKEQN